MTKPRFTLSLIAITGVVFLAACSEPEAPAAEGAAEPTAATAPQEVSFEPAYPEEVSTEGLSDEDLEQQDPGHGHGDGGAHDHGDGEHPHDDPHHDEEHAGGEDHGHAH